MHNPDYPLSAGKEYSNGIILLIFVAADKTDVETNSRE